MSTYSPEKFELKGLPFEVNRLTPRIGAEILNIDLSKSLDKELKELIYEALLVYKVIFFREQDLTT
ncbi:MAG TPA: TauD/TfdA family dioxygenase, partial [SAR86 cluster bacterium]|nr:TauD/TfdA family dioxygenase [SAR86 cluster bacterium]